MRQIMGLVWVVTVWCLAQDRISGRASAFQPSNEITLAEQALQAALRDGLRAQALTLVSPGFFRVDSNGALNNPSEFLSRIEPGAVWGTERTLHVNEYDDAAVVLGVSESTGRRFRFLRIWLRTGDGWRLLAFQVTPIDSSQPTNDAGRAPRQAKTENDFIVSTTARTPVERELVESFRGLQRAERNADSAGFAARTADDFQVVGFTGDVRTKAQRVEDIRRQSSDTSFPTVSEVDVQVIGAAAVMRALQEPTGGRPAFRWTRLWVRVNDQWRQVINQQTALTELR